MPSGPGANTAICNALGPAVALDKWDTVRAALELGEARERPLTDHTQRRAGEIAGSRLLAGGMNWDDESMRAARSTPTGTRELVMG
jgi:2-methyl-3-hydroxypyridine 5-carboxylic acid dioxygenase